jgi:carbamoyl-phosphate synthase small subunit
MVRCFLVLEDGTALEGESFGHPGTVAGEIVFTTSMSGYQESITDPAYKGQILVSAFPLIGCYGISDKYDISDKAHISGLVVREYCKEPSDMYGGRTLDDFLKEQKVPGISGIDTRDIVGTIRDNGTMNAAIVSTEKEIEAVKKKLKKFDLDKEALVPLVSSKNVKKIDNGKKVTIGVLDCGADRRMIEDLSSFYNVIVFPHDTKAKEITASKVKALVVSGGPGNPDIVTNVTETIKQLSVALPIAGVALGAQLIANAFGCKTMKLKFGHHGSSQPVKHSDRVFITTQNHMYTIDPASVKGTGIVIDQKNVNDGTTEGFSHSSLPIFGIMYQPSSPKYETHSFFYEKLQNITEVRK